jgi:hypothetical protein
MKSLKNGALSRLLIFNSPFPACHQIHRPACKRCICCLVLYAAANLTGLQCLLCAGGLAWCRAFHQNAPVDLSIRGTPRPARAMRLYRVTLRTSGRKGISSGFEISSPSIDSNLTRTRLLPGSSTIATWPPWSLAVAVPSARRRDCRKCKSSPPRTGVHIFVASQPKTSFMNVYLRRRPSFRAFAVSMLQPSASSRAMAGCPQKKTPTSPAHCS